VVGSIAVIPVAVASLLALPNLYDATVSLLDQRKSNAVLTAEQAQLQGGVAQGVDVAFLTWVRGHFAGGDTFYLITRKSTAEQAIIQWGLFQLAPHLETERPAAANWLVFYESSPTRYSFGRLHNLEVYTPGFAVERNGRAR
jgi:hypothetical protein